MRSQAALFLSLLLLQLAPSAAVLVLMGGLHQTCGGNYSMNYDNAIKTPWGLGWCIAPFTKWRRPEGPASFFTDRMALRKSLSLCYTCEHTRLPKRWEERYLYQKITSFHGDGIGYDYCRADEPTSLYVAEEGDLGQAYTEMIPSVAETKKRDRFMTA